MWGQTKLLGEAFYHAPPTSVQAEVVERRLEVCTCFEQEC